MKFLVIALYAMSFGSACAKEQYTVASALTKANQAWLNERIETIGTTLMWANDYANDNGPGIFCPPPNATVAGPQWRLMLEHTLKAMPSYHDIELEKLPLVMISAAEITFPCR
ncbi:hypothetical protein [Pararhizobium sp.]|uniref:hypothetical protein n=1 Tax=Pararhizobium sp. TaxID=1977563 RepID=UPI00271C1AC3|nr:hypothetical protein [Pararhizobium sp.]MDO9415385.1 hypothetical protein [Pararhizobium sp.]